MKRVLVLLAVLAFSVSAFARMSKYKGWESSPEGYFMTEAERGQWAKIDSDADAERFIADFHAKRLDNFQAEVANRAANADKYLTVAKTPGSKTVRGKVVILLGPPTQMDMSSRVVTDAKHDNPAAASSMTNMNEGGGGTVTAGHGTRAFSEVDPGSTGGTIATSDTVQILHFSYQGAVAKHYDRKTIDINVEVNPRTGRDLIASRSEAADVDSIFELAVQSWIKK
jgi:GWxTD domain-containing protein